MASEGGGVAKFVLNIGSCANPCVAEKRQRAKETLLENRRTVAMILRKCVKEIKVDEGQLHKRFSHS